MSIAKVVFACVLPAAYILSAGATTYVVYPDGTGDFPTIQAAIETATHGDIIELTNGTFTGDGNRDIDFLEKAITVRSQGGDPDSCIIDCEASETDPHRGLYLHLVLAPGGIIEGVTVKNAYTINYGGGVFCDVSDVTVNNCVFENNRGNAGGGFRADQGAAQVSGCVFVNNTAMQGGGVYCDQTTLVMTDCVFSDNVAYDRGGGLVLSRGNTSATLAGLIFILNGARWGGALGIEGADVSASGCTFLDNYALHDGGAVFITGSQDSDIEFTGCTMCRNLADSGGGLYFQDPGTASFQNVIIAFCPDGGAVRGELGYSPIISCSDIYGNVGGDWVGWIADQFGVRGNFSADPCFCDMENDDFHLWNYSPCDQLGCGLIGAWPVGCWDPQDVDGQRADVSGRAGIHMSATPNPFASTTVIRYDLPAGMEAGGAFLGVYDVSGRLVRALVTGVESGGIHSARWDGIGTSGVGVDSGVYLCRLTVGETTLTTRLLLLR